MKKILISVVAVALIVPQVAMAAWWNPFTWKIFNKSADVRIEQTHDVNIENKKAATIATSTAVISQQKETSKKNINSTIVSSPKKIVETPAKPTETISQIVPKQEEIKTNKTVILPSGAIAEVDARGDFVRWVKEVPVVVVPAISQLIQPQTTTGIQIHSINVAPAITTARIEWKTDKPTDSKIFLSGAGLSSKVYSSESGFSTRHIVSVGELNAGSSYSYEIEAISQGIAVKMSGVFATNGNRPSKISLITQGSGYGLYCSSTGVIVRILDQDGKEMLGQPVEVLSTYSNVVKKGVSPLVADFGLNAMREANFLLKIKSGDLTAEREITVRDPKFQELLVLDRGGGIYMEASSALTLIKTDEGFECAH